MWTPETSACYGQGYKPNLTFGRKSFEDNIAPVSVTITDVTAQRTKEKGRS
jgi:hypothetical protein